MFIKLNDGRTVNLMHICEIMLDNNSVVYKPARGSNTDIREWFDTSELATKRYEEIVNQIMIV